MPVRLFLALLVVTVGLVVPAWAAADDGDDQAEIRIRGTCTARSVSALRIRSEEGALRIEFRIDSVRRAVRTWTILILRERRTAFRGVLRPAGRSRSVELRRTLADWPGAEQVVVRAVASDRETCRASGVV